MCPNAVTRCPNIVIITCHDIGDYQHCYGTPVSTPNIDSLADEGVLFGNHFSTATICSPSRGSIVTGCYPPTNGLTGNVHRGDELDQDRYPTLATQLAQRGYETHLFGFQHEHWDSTKLGYQVVHEGASRHVDDVVPEFVQWLGARLADAGPFLAGMGFTETHRLGGSPTGFQYPSYEPADPAEVEVRPYLPDIPAVREELADFYGAVKLVDAGVGQVLRALAQAGLRDSTLVIFTSDHGASFLHSKATLYDGGTRVALLLRWPGVLPSGHKVQSLTSHVDILPTIYDLCGWAAPAHVQGRSCADAANGIAEGPGRRYVYAGRGYDGRMVRSLEWKYTRYLSSRCVFDTGLREIVLCPAGVWENQQVFDHYETLRNREELFDLCSDPAELHNLVNEPECQPVLDEMRAALDAHLQATGDAFRTLSVPEAFDPPARGWEWVREAYLAGDANVAEVVALLEV